MHSRLQTTILTRSYTVEGRSFAVLEYRGEPVVTAQALSGALGYPARNAVWALVRGGRSEDFEERLHFHLPTAEEVRELRDGRGEPVVPRGRAPLLLTLAGAQLVAIYARGPAARAFRGYLVDVVIPEWTEMRRGAAALARLEAVSERRALMRGALERPEMRHAPLSAEMLGRVVEDTRLVVEIARAQPGVTPADLRLADAVVRELVGLERLRGAQVDREERLAGLARTAQLQDDEIRAHVRHTQALEAELARVRRIARAYEAGRVPEEEVDA